MRPGVRPCILTASPPLPPFPKHRIARFESFLQALPREACWESLPEWAFPFCSAAPATSASSFAAPFCATSCRLFISPSSFSPPGRLLAQRRWLDGPTKTETWSTLRSLSSSPRKTASSAHLRNRCFAVHCRTSRRLSAAGPDSASALMYPELTSSIRSFSPCSRNLSKRPRSGPRAW